MVYVFSITYQPKNQKYGDRRDYFNRISLETAILIENYGIAGDQKAGGKPTRQLSLLSYEWLAERQQEGYKTNPGDFGEQIIIKGWPIETLKPGDRLQLGKEALIEMTEPRKGCLRLGLAQGTASKLPYDYIGIMAKVITGGTIHRGDPVQLLRLSCSDSN